MELDPQLEKVVREATKAAELQESEAFQQAVKNVRESCVDAWRNSGPADTATRETAYHLLRALDVLTSNVNIQVERGKVAKAQLERAKGRR